MAGELGLEPRMTVPKTGVLPLHHSPAGPAFQRGCPLGRRSDTPSRSGMQQHFLRCVRRASRDLSPASPIVPSARAFAILVRSLFFSFQRLPRERTDNFRLAIWPLAAAKPRRYKPRFKVGVWLSLVEHCLREAGVGGSNPLTPTISFRVPETRTRSKERPAGALFSFQPSPVRWAFAAASVRWAPTASMVRSPSALRLASSSGEPAS
jgi:hypothetical protein